MFGMIGTLLTLFVSAAVIYAAILTVNAVISWFKNRASLVQSDRNNLAFTIRERLADGNYAVYQGIFNSATEQLLDGQKLVGERLDSELTNLHRDKPLVIYR
jgi:hypothetical protein